MERSETLRRKGRPMIARRVPDVPIEPEAGVGVGDRTGHQPVPHRLRDDRRGGDRRTQMIAPHDGAVIRSRRREGEAVDETDLRARLDRRERPAEQSKVGPVQALTIDRGRRRAEHHDLLGVAHHRGGDALPNLTPEPLRVVQIDQGPAAGASQRLEVETHGRHDQRPGQAAAPRLVDARNPTNSERAVMGEQPRRGPMGSWSPPTAQRTGPAAASDRPRKSRDAPRPHPTARRRPRQPRYGG